MPKKFLVLYSHENKYSKELQEERQEVETALNNIYGKDIEIIYNIAELPKLFGKKNYELLLANENIKLMAQVDMVVCARGFANSPAAINYKIIANMYDIPVWEMVSFSNGIGKCYI